MILYQLKCGQDHDFEAWFLNGAAYDSQQASGDVSCPHCGTTNITKAPMAPNIARGKSGDSARPTDEHRAHEVAEKILEAVDGLRREVEGKCDYVGDEFAEETRRIHYGETKERGIYGEASEEEAEELDEEGIDFFRLPFARRRDD